MSHREISKLHGAHRNKIIASPRRCFLLFLEDPHESA